MGYRELLENVTGRRNGQTAGIFAELEEMEGRYLAGGLTPDQREVVERFYGIGCWPRNCQEIARDMGVNVAWVDNIWGSAHYLMEGRWKMLCQAAAVSP